MGVLNSEMFLSAKDLSSTMEFSFLVGPALEFQENKCQTAAFQDVHDDDQPQQLKEEDDKSKSLMMAAPSELKLPCSEAFKVHENDGQHEDHQNNDGFKTPTSLDHKIPVMLKCPPAPKKPKSLPILPKRKACGRRILLDLTKEIESLFPPALLADLGNRIKKVRQGSDFR